MGTNGNLNVKNFYVITFKNKELISKKSNLK